MQYEHTNKQRDPSGGDRLRAASLGAISQILPSGKNQTGSVGVPPATKRTTVRNGLTKEVYLCGRASGEGDFITNAGSKTIH